MEIKNYPLFVEGLLSEASAVDFNSRLMTTVCGLAGEAAECLSNTDSFLNIINDDDKLIDECGDVLWYVALACTTLNLSFDNLVAKAKNSEQIDVYYNILQLSQNTGKYADTVKKHLFHGKVLNVDGLSKLVLNIIENIEAIAIHYNISIQKIIDINVEKLKDRYKSGKFTVEEFMKKEEAKGKDE
jgi:hypothetical protein